MRLRIETRIKGEVIMQIMAGPGVSDGDLATMLEDAEQDLRWSVMQDTETVYIGA